MRFFVLFFIYTGLIFAQEGGSNDRELTQLVPIKDRSGLSVEELREKAKQLDSIKTQASWDKLSPTPKKYDWIQTKSGEWFRGEIKAMYNEELEFDSKEIGLYTFKFKDIKKIKSYHLLSVNIEGVASISGIVRYKGGKIHIIQGEHTYTFNKNQIVSFAPAGKKERQYWSGKITINLDLRSGNKEQFDYNAKANINRRTATTRLRLDYLGRISSNDGEETANDHRINEKYDVYITRYFFWTPIFSEYYQDKFQNIRSQYTFGAGLGYTIVDSPSLEWDISGGPAAIYTRYITVEEDENANPKAFSLEMSTRLEYEITDKTDINYQYKLTFTGENSGGYKHHMVLALENEILSWLDFDITTIWDYTYSPQITSDGTQPYKNDYQLLFGLGIEF